MPEELYGHEVSRESHTISLRSPTNALLLSNSHHPPSALLPARRPLPSLLLTQQLLLPVHPHPLQDPHHLLISSHRRRFCRPSSTFPSSRYTDSSPGRRRLECVPKLVQRYDLLYNLKDERIVDVEGREEGDGVRLAAWRWWAGSSGRSGWCRRGNACVDRLATGARGRSRLGSGCWWSGDVGAGRRMQREGEVNGGDGDQVGRVDETKRGAESVVDDEPVE